MTNAGKSGLTLGTLVQAGDGQTDQCLLQRWTIARTAIALTQFRVTQRTHQRANHVGGNAIAGELAEQLLLAELQADFFA
ncbi:hypothetical protein D3C71_1560950 [compost metagenome]